MRRARPIRPFSGSSVLCGMAALVALIPMASGGSGQPNIVWIVGEDHSALLGAYGHTQAATPHLDRMAAEGVIYDRAYAPVPICAPARFALITGRYAAAHYGSEGMRGWSDLPEPYVFFPQFFREAGYYTANWGKTDYNTGRYLGGDTDLTLEAAWDGTRFIWEPLGDDAPERGPHWRHRPDPGSHFSNSSTS